MSSINLRTLQRIDASITCVIQSCCQAAVYKFGDNNEWKTCEYEGALHFFHRSQEPKFGWIVMNRSNPTNLVENVTQDVEVKLCEPYLLYKSGAKQIYCIWFYDRKECREVHKIIQIALRKSLNKSLSE